MSTDINTPAIDHEFETVLRDAVEGKPISTAAARRIREEAAQITQDIRRVHGVVDDATFDSLLEHE